MGETDYGLLGGIARGFREGLTAYDTATERRRAQEEKEKDRERDREEKALKREMDQKVLKINMRKAGLEEDESGSLKETEEAATKRDQDRALKAYGSLPPELKASPDGQGLLRRAMPGLVLGAPRGNNAGLLPSFSAGGRTPERPLPIKPSAGDKKLDQEFATEYNDWTSGGKAAVDKNLESLNEVADMLSGKTGKKPSDYLSGRFAGRLPDILRTDQSVDTRDRVQQAVMGTLRATLGPQFTEKEGKRIFDLAYNEKLEPAENAKRIIAQVKYLREMRDAKEDKSRFYERRRSLFDYKPSKFEYTPDGKKWRVLPDGSREEVEGKD